MFIFYHCCFNVFRVCIFGIYVYFDVFVLFFPVLICVSFLSVLGLLVSPAEGSSLPPKRCVLNGGEVNSRQ
jgi:hypothetical protein